MKNLLYVFALVVFFSCDKSADKIPVSPAEMKSISYNENVALFDTRVRAVDPQHYIKELVFADFSQKGILGDLVNFEGTTFMDNGLQFDKTAGDGIFTAVEKIPYNDSVKAGSLSESQPKSLLEAPIVGPTFKRSAELAAYRTSHARSNAVSSPNARQAPDVVVCVAYWNGNCYAHQWGLCNQCCLYIDCHHYRGW